MKPAFPPLHASPHVTPPVATPPAPDTTEDPAQSPAPDDPNILAQAAEWFALLRADKPSASDTARWRQWLHAHPAHQRAWARVQAIDQQFSRLPTADKTAARQALDTAAQRQASRRQALHTLAVLAAGGLGTWAALRLTPWPSWLAAHRTVTGESRHLHLADGASLWLNTATAIDTDYSPQLRRIRLHSGEILIHTQPDTASPARPFVVDTPQARLRALGTRFAVRQLGREEGIASVFEGAVHIQPRRAGAEQGLTLQAGQQAHFSAHAIQPPTPAESARQSWAQGLLVAEDMRLHDFLQEVSRYRDGPPIRCHPRVADLRIVGAYPLADPDRLLATLQATLPVRVHTRGNAVEVGPR